MGRILQSIMVEGRVTKDMVRGPAAVMGSFSAKTHLACALGLIDDAESASIHAIRSVRNEFAHNIATDLDDQKVRSKLKPLCWAIGKTEPGDYDGYQIFHLAAQRTIMQLLNRADHAMAGRAHGLRPRSRLRSAGLHLLGASRCRAEPWCHEAGAEDLLPR